MPMFKTISNHKIPICAGATAFALHFMCCLFLQAQPSEGSWQWFPAFLADFPASIAFLALPISAHPLLVFGLLGSLWWFVLMYTITYALLRLRRLANEA
jgi:hypothetical protein